MDAPPIQYARTEDGVNIAYWTLGEGPAVVIAPGSNLSHASKEWEIPTYRRWYTELSERFRVIRYDPRGLGLSDLEINDASLTNMVVDLSAVLDAAGVDRAALIGQFWFGPTVTQFAASHPDRVSCLVLWGTQASNQMLAESEIMRSMSSLMKTSWDTAVTVLLSAVPSEDKPGWERHLHDLRPDQPARRELLDAALSPWAQHNVTETLHDVQAPTFVLNTSWGDEALEDDARKLARGIQDCRVVSFSLDSFGWALLAEDSRTQSAVQTFLEESLEAERRETRWAPAGGLRTLLFTDLESSTALTQALGDAKAQEVLRGHNDAVRTALDAHGGEEVKHTGDGIFAAFGSAVSAVEAALQIQRALAGAEVRGRVGLNAGEPIAEDDDYFGAAVQLAARVCDRAEPGQVLVSNVVKELCTGKLFQFDDQGEVTLKGFPEPVRLFVVGEGTDL